ncbi:MAG: HAD family phosphatase [Myxococcales bacterium]|nr:HAD family phosphatase [Myxococcales bacterium]
MRPLEELGRAAVAPLIGVLCDIDDTLTLDGRLVPEAFLALEELQRAGLAVIPVTGRPAGWCDMIARQWPVSGVVGENGGLWFWMGAPERGGTGGADGALRLRRGFWQPAAEREKNRATLDAAAGRILAAVPGTALASDQGYRVLDLAIDFCEDVPPLPRPAVDAIVDAFTEIGATCKVSSIHVNGWFGDFNKLSGFGRLVAELGLPSDPARWAFVGDSANDAPMFSHFPLSVGVANVDHFLDRIPHWPRYRCEERGGVGFTAFAHRLLTLREAVQNQPRPAARDTGDGP